MTGILIIAVFIIALVVGVPIVFVLGLSCLTYFLVKGMSVVMIVQRMFVGLDVFVIMAIPFFILAGKLMLAGGTMTPLIEFAKALVGHLRGGVAQVSVVASMLFGGVTGAATAAIAALGPLELKMMKDSGYKKEFAAAVVTSAACVSPVIPPSLNMIIYAVVASVSIGHMFIAAVIPGILLGLAMMTMVWFYAKKHGLPTTRKCDRRRLFQALLRALGPLGLPFLILGGIYSGIFTPTEAAALACLYAFILGKFIYKKLTWKGITDILFETGCITAGILAIISISACFSWIIAIERVPETCATILLSISKNPYVLLLLINIVLLMLGCFMEGIAAILITAPIFVPIVTSLGIDPIHFGVIMSINLTLGLLTPPLGLSLFVTSAISGLPIESIAWSALPFFILGVLVLLLLTMVPPLVLFLPQILGM